MTMAWMQWKLGKWRLVNGFRGQVGSQWEESRLYWGFWYEGKSGQGCHKGREAWREAWKRSLLRR
jgi:hypothetical protein